MTDLSDLGEFRRLSASLSYVLMAASGSAERVLDMILEDRRLPPGDEEDLVELIRYVLRAWAGMRRRLGPTAALHPLRAAALLTKVLPEVRKIDLAVMLLHDKVEDIGPTGRTPEEWRELEEGFARLERRMDPEGRWEIDARLRALARIDRAESYCAYLARLVESSRERPDVVRAKLADRLDNTLDFALDFRDPLDEADFFEQAFLCLCIPSWPGPPRAGNRSSAPLLELSWRLYGLYKNVVLLSLLRPAEAGSEGGPCAVLMQGLVDASFKEAQRVGLELLTGHRDVLRNGRDLLRDAMEYCHAGFAFRVTDVTAGHALDGLLVNTFDTPDPGARVRRLEALAEDPPLLFEGAVTFLTMFAAFRRDPTFVVRGIGPAGVRPAD